MFVWWAAFFFAGALFPHGGVNAAAALGAASAMYLLTAGNNPAIRSRAFLTATTGLFVLITASLSPVDTGILAGSSIPADPRRSSFPGPVGPVRDRITDLTGERRMTRGTRGLLRALLIADKRSLPAEVRDGWRKTGTAHYLALSGLHIGLIAVPLFGMLTLAGARGVFRDLISILVLSFYAAVAGLPGSLLRALSMIAVIRASRIAGIRTGPGRCVLAGAFLVCILDPASLCDTGFLLSFNAAAGVALLGIPACRSVQIRLAGIRGGKILQFPLVAAVMSICVQASMLPLSVRIFGSAPLAGPVMSVLMALPVTVLLYGGFIYVIAGHLISSVTVPALNTVSGLASGMVSLGAHMPAAVVLMTDFQVEQYILGLSILATVPWVSKRRRIVFAAGLFMALIAFRPLISGDWKAREAEIRFHAGGAVLYGGEGGVLVLDGFPSLRSAAFLTRELRRIGVRGVETIVVQRPGERFADGISSIARDLGPDRIMHSPWHRPEIAGRAEHIAVWSDTVISLDSIRLAVKAPSILPGRGARAYGKAAALSISPLD